VFRELMLKFDFDRIAIALKDLKIHVPSIITNADSNCSVFNDRVRISLVQLNHTSLSDYTIGKIYLNINSETEIALDGDYNFSFLNFYRASDENTIHSYDAIGNKVSEYIIDREVLTDESDRTYMTKSNGDVYHPSYRKSDNALVEQIRLAWEDKLMCYSLKQDGRLSFYIFINHEIEAQVSTGNFLYEGN
jgi:hypothetical protein